MLNIPVEYKCFFTQLYVTQSAKAADYTNCISAEG